MGKLRYDGISVEFDDRVLTHLQVVIISKLRRRHGFQMSWATSVAAGSGRTSIWLDPSIPLRFTYDGSRSPSIDPEWVAALGRSADSSAGLVVTNEDGSPAFAK